MKKYGPMAIVSIIDQTLYCDEVDCDTDDIKNQIGLQPMGKGTV